MQIVDANVLVYAADEDSPHHATARSWLKEALDGHRALGFAWMVLLAFLRLSTQANAFAHPLTVEEATDLLERWLGQPSAVRVEPGSRHMALVRGLLLEVGTAGNLVGDAHLAALALEHGAEVVSFDPDFGRFAGVPWRLPA